MQTRHRKQSRVRGITLVEILLYVALFPIVMFATVSFLTTLVDSAARIKAASAVNDQGLYVMEQISDSLRSGYLVQSPTPGSNGATIQIQPESTGAQFVSYQIQGSTVEFTDTSSSVFSLTGTDIICSSLNFENLATLSTPDSVRFSFTCQFANPENIPKLNYSRTFTKTITLPNFE